MTVFKTRGLNRAKLTSMGFNVMQEKDDLLVRRGKIVGRFSQPSRFEPGTLSLTNLGDIEDDFDAAVRDVQRVAAVGVA